MTSYSRSSYDDEWGSFVWELRTVNHRYLDIQLRVPDLFNSCEMRIRQLIQKYIKRGKIDASLRFLPGPDFPSRFSLDINLVKELSSIIKQFQPHFPKHIINLSDILFWKGILRTSVTHDEKLNEKMLSLLDSALVDLVAMRENEGRNLRLFLETCAEKLQQEIKQVTQHIPAVLETARQRIQERLLQVSAELNTQRLEQEMVMWAQRVDVTEEIQRLSMHLRSVKQVLESGGVMGRRLDFLMQELNREANTLSSKSLCALTTQSAIEMKVLIEQMREQIQNIE